MVFGADTYRAFAQMLAASTEGADVRDPWVTRMRNLPASLLPNTLQDPLGWPDATVASGDAANAAHEAMSDPRSLLMNPLGVGRTNPRSVNRLAAVPLPDRPSAGPGPTFSGVDSVSSFCVRVHSQVGHRCLGFPVEKR
jgi:hypothetical protein